MDETRNSLYNAQPIAGKQFVEEIEWLKRECDRRMITDYVTW